jgi:hypothetical protein
MLKLLPLAWGEKAVLHEWRIEWPAASVHWYVGVLKYHDILLETRRKFKFITQLIFAFTDYLIAISFDILKCGFRGLSFF